MLTSAYIDTFQIHGGSNGLGLTGTDLGSPAPRPVADVRPYQHGAVDRTAYYGPRVLELRGCIHATDKATLWSLLDDLKGNLALGSTHVLKFRRDGETFDQRAEFRVDGPVLTPVASGMTGPYVTWSVAIFCADPRFYSDTESSASYDPTTTGTGGLLFSLDFPLEFSGDGSATLDVVNEGNVGTPPTFTITGPVTNPIIDNDSTGESIYTTGVALTSSQTLVINVADRTCLLDGTTNRPDLIDASATTWFDLEPGTNQLRMRGLGMSSGQTALSVIYRSARV